MAILKLVGVVAIVVDGGDSGIAATMCLQKTFIGSINNRVSL
jgi:hypothetical protein